MAKHADPSPSGSSPASLKVVSGEQLVKNAKRKAKSMSAGDVADVKTQPNQLTPSRENHLMPQSIAMETDTPPIQSIKTEELVKQEPPSPEQLEAVVSFCSEALGRGVLSLPDLRNRLLLKKTSLSVESQVNLLSQQGVSDRVLEEALSLCGAMAVGQPCNKKLYALSHGDPVSQEMRKLMIQVVDINVVCLKFVVSPTQCREAMLTLFQSNKSLKKKQLVEELNSRGLPSDVKTVTATLKVGIIASVCGRTREKHCPRKIRRKLCIF